MRPGALLAATIAVGVFATTLEVAAQHRDHHPNTGVPSGSQGNEPTTPTAPSHPAGDKGSGDGHDTPAVDARRDGQRAPNLAGDKLQVGSGKDDTLDLRITVFQGRGRNFLRTFKEHGPKDSANGKSNTFHMPLISAMPDAGNTDAAHHNPLITHHQAKPHFGSYSVTHRNAVGAIVEAGKGGFQRGFRARTDNLANSGGVRGLESNAGDRTKDAKHLVGQGPVGSTNPTDFGERNLHPGPRSSTPATNAATINGTTTIHPRSGTGAVGGPVKIVSGTINGTGFRIRHP